MIPHNPLTPPPDTVDDILPNSHHPSPLNTSLFATPTSNTALSVSLSNSEFNSEEEPSDGEVEEHDTSDEDMEDGGAALTASNVQLFAFAMDGVESEDIAAENILSLVYPAHLPSTESAHGTLFPNAFPTPQDFDTMTIGVQDVLAGNYGAAFGDESDDGSDTGSVVSETVGEVVQQLQQLQDVQEHEVLQGPPPLITQHTIMNNSIIPFYFPPHLNLPPLPPVANVQYVAMGQVAAVTSMPVAPPSQNAPHLWATAGWTPSPAFDYELEQLYPEPQWILDNTDEHEVEDNQNLGLGEFLAQWARNSAALASQSNTKRSRNGPSIPEVEAQRFPASLPPVKTKDLQGERCDFQRYAHKSLAVSRPNHETEALIHHQRIDWHKLGVQRSEAKQRRRQTYRNYTNLRVAPKWHVSYPIFLPTKQIWRPCRPPKICFTDIIY